jgi:hypothetical protein
MRCFVFSAGEMGVGPVGVAPAQPFAHIYPGERIWTDGSLVIQAWIRICLRGGVWLSVYQWLRGSRNEFVVRTPVRPNISLGDSVAGLHAAFGTVSVSRVHCR